MYRVKVSVKNKKYSYKKVYMNNEMSMNTAFRPMGSDFFGHTFQVSCGYLKNCVLVCLDRQTSKLNTVRDLKKM